MKRLVYSVETIIVGLDGEWPAIPIPQHPDIKIFYSPTPLGQRAMTNQLCRLSTAKYVMKLDAHCSFDKGFDVKLMEDMKDDWTVVPKMYNLHVFNWICPNGHRRYMSPPGACEECGKETEKEIVWERRMSRLTYQWRFDKDLHFQYWTQRKVDGDLVETMSLLGACWMLTRDKYWELNICDEEHGSWGQQGTEVSCKTWLSGGKVIVNKKTWFAHMFRTQGKGFGFPYPISGEQQEHAKKYSKELFLGNKFKGKYKLDWLIKKFNPPEWKK